MTNISNTYVKQKKVNQLKCYSYMYLFVLTATGKIMKIAQLDDDYAV